MTARLRFLLPVVVAAFVPAAGLAQDFGGEWAEQRRWVGPDPLYPRGESFGSAIGVIGDVDWDGYPDFATTSPGSDLGPWGVYGAVHCVSSQTGQILWTTFAPSGGWGGFARMIAFGDISLDGVSEVLVSSPGASINVYHDGAVAMLDGRTGSIMWTVAGTANPAPSTSGDMLGSSIGVVDDLDGDYRPDVVAGAPARRKPPVSGVQEYDGVLYFLSSMTGAKIKEIHSVHPDSTLGSAVAPLGCDLDLDGLNDVATCCTGAPGFVPYEREATVQILSLGSGALILEIGPPSRDVDILSSAYLQTLDDLDGDGLNDLMVAARNLLTTPVQFLLVSVSSTGSFLSKLPLPDGAFPYYADAGCTAGCLLGDLTGDGLAEVAIGMKPASSLQPGKVVILDPLRNVPLWRLDGIQGEDRFGSSVARWPVISPLGSEAILVGAPGFWPSGTVGPAGVVLHYDLLPWIHGASDSISASQGGLLPIEVKMPGSEAGKAYRLLVSASGTGPTTLAGITIPLTIDQVFRDNWRGAYSAWIQGGFGALDPTGSASILVTVPAGALSPLVGRTLSFAAVSFASGSAPSRSTSCLVVSVLP